MTDKIKVFTLLPRVSNLVALSFGQGERAAVSLRFVDKGSDHIDVIFRNLGSCNFKNEKEVILIVGILPFLGHFESLAKGRLICPYQRGRGGPCLSPEALGEHLKQSRMNPDSSSLLLRKKAHLYWKIWCTHTGHERLVQHLFHFRVDIG